MRAIKDCSQQVLFPLSFSLLKKSPATSLLIFTEINLVKNA